MQVSGGALEELETASERCWSISSMSRSISGSAESQEQMLFKKVCMNHRQIC